MNDPADVGFVDAQPERDGGADDLKLVADERFLDLAALVIFHAGVIMRRPETAGRKPRRHVFRRLAAQAVDDARLLLSLGQEAQNLLQAFLSRIDRKA